MKRYPWQLQRKLSLLTSKEVDLTINENISTFLSVKKDRKKLQLSLHKLFLHASESVCEAIADFSMYKDRKALQYIRTFAGKYFQEVDLSSTLNKGSLKPSGKYYHLKEIYSKLNKNYFKNQIDLNITWFKKPIYRTFSHITYGSYNRLLKLIRINEILDKATVPLYFVEYVVYHEMLHHICPSYIDSQGKERVHTPLFKQREREFPHFEKAKWWEKHGRT